MKGKLFEVGNEEGNFALAYRRMMESGYNLGAWVGTDIRNSSLDNTFWQFSGGVEALSHDYDFRANFYVPLTDPQAGGAGLTQVVVQGNNIVMIGGQEVALYGVDAEAGIRLPLEGLSKAFSAVELRAYGGGYYFNNADVNQEVSGGKARLELRVPDIFESMPGSQLTAGYEFTYDDVRQARHQAGLKLRIPFGEISEFFSGSDRPARLTSLNPQERRMLDGIVRDTDIVTGASGSESVVDDATNVALNRVAYADDLATLQSAIGQGANTHIVVRDGGTAIDVTSLGGVTLQDNQTIQGGSSTILLRGAGSGTVAPYTADGGQPTFTGSVESAFKIANGSAGIHVAGLNIDASGFTNVFANSADTEMDDLRNIVIEQNDIRNFPIFGVLFGSRNQDISILNNKFEFVVNAVNFNSDNSRVRIAGNIFTGRLEPVSSEPAIWLETRNDNFVIHNNEFSKSDGALYVGFGHSSNFTITDNWFHDLVYSAIRFFDDDSELPGESVSNLVVAGNTFESIDGDGVYIEDGALDVLITDNTFRDATVDGIFIDDRSQHVTIFGNSLFNIGEHGIYLDNENRDVAILDNTIDDTGEDGVRIDKDNSHVLVAQNDIKNTGEAGIAFKDRNTFVGVVDNTVAHTGEEGIVFRDDNSLVLVSGNTVMRSGLDKSEPYQSGIKLNHGNVAVVLGNTVTDPGTNGIAVDTGNAALVAGNEIAGITRGNGINVNAFNELVFGGNRFGSVAGSLFHFDGAGNELLPASTVVTLLQTAVSSDPALLAELRRAALAAGIGNAEFDRFVADLFSTLLSPNVAAVAPGGFCSQGTPVNFTGTLETIDPSGVLRSFADGC